MKQAIRPASFKWQQTEPGLILCAVRWHLRYSLSFRDVEDLLRERGLEADHTTIWRWGQRYGPELEERLRRHLKPTNKSWRVDETYVRVKGRWCYLYRALDSTGATIDFVLSGWRDAAAATRLFRKALTDPAHPQPRVINTDRARLYGSAIAGVKKEGILRRRCRNAVQHAQPPPSLAAAIMADRFDRRTDGSRRVGRACQRTTTRRFARFVARAC